jgi:hypothetical protein
MPTGDKPPLRPRDAARILFDAGWVQGENWLKMLCTAAAESDLYPEAFHVNDNGTTDWGWLQLNDQGKKGKELEDFKAMAFDPVAAAAHARVMYVERGFQPWVAYNSGAWTKKLTLGCVGLCNSLAVKFGIPPII